MSASKSTGVEDPGWSGGLEAKSAAETSGFQRLGSTYLVYLICGSALAAILTLMHFGYLARESSWLWFAVFAAIPLLSLLANHIYIARPSRLTMNARIAILVAIVTTVNYLTGWGPVLWGSFAFVALETVSMAKSSVWRITAAWCLAGIATGEVLISLNWMPSRLGLAEANSMALMGAFVLAFVIWMAGATTREKEDAEVQRRLSEDRFRSLIQDSSDITFVIDSEGCYAYASPAVEELLGYQPDDLVGRPATDLVHPDDRERVLTRLGPELQDSSESAFVQFRMEQKDGAWRDVEAVVANQLSRPSVSGYVAHVRDITERKEFEALLAHRALHDPLTGLANRQLILDRADQMIHRARRSLEPIAAFFIDLDNFKEANDSLGHESGDRLLQGVGDRLESILRPSDTVGRLGGDEFVVLAEGMSLANGPQLLADRIREVLSEPFFIEGFEAIPVTVTASIGIAVGDRPTAQDLLRDADVALYRSKASGRDRAIVFEPHMQKAITGRLKLRADLETALENDEFFLLYQPMIGLEHGEIRGVEALLRWQHPTLGVIEPDDFIPLLEDGGLIVEVGRWILQAACAQAARWRALGHRHLLSVNVSIRQLEASSFVEDVRSAIAANDLDPAALMIEVSESVLMKDSNSTVSALRRLKDVGVQIAIDDFGTGHYSLAFLRQFPVDLLKIDRTCIASMDGSADSTALIGTLMDLGRALGLATLAEGIEDENQLDRLRRNRCDSGQGFMFSQPVEPAMVEALVLHTTRSSNFALPGAQTPSTPFV